MTKDIIKANKNEIFSLSYYPEAFHLLLYLRFNHAKNLENFQIPAGFVKIQLGWEEAEIRRAIRTLLREGFIKQTFHGGGAINKPHQYCWIEGKNDA